MFHLGMLVLHGSLHILVAHLRFAPTADAARTKRAALTNLPYTLLFASSYGKKSKKKLGSGSKKPARTSHNSSTESPTECQNYARLAATRLQSSRSAL